MSGDLRPTGIGPGQAGNLEEWVARTTGSSHGRGPVREVHWVEQVHGCRVVALGRGGTLGGGSAAPSLRVVFDGTGDALVTDGPDVALAVLTADCGSIALGSEEGVIGAVHAGWRGLVDGVIERAVGAMRAMGATDVSGALGPCIHPGCYEFSEPELAEVAAVYGDGVRGRTAAGGSALDLPAAVSAALAAAGVRVVAGRPACTACAGGYFSHRARGDAGRQALVVWSAALDRVR